MSTWNWISFRALHQRKAILEVLIAEQNGLCVYCLQKITPKDATIEHLICQSHNQALDLEYLNLFAVCKGNEGKVETSHCDKYRANGADNNYFFPVMLFERCKTTSINDINPFFDVEYNSRTQFISGRILGSPQNIKGFPNIQRNIEETISILNLNCDKLVNARRFKWDQVKKTKAENNYTWQQLFDYYLTQPKTDFQEFVLMAIHKQISNTTKASMTQKSVGSGLP